MRTFGGAACKLRSKCVEKIIPMGMKKSGSRENSCSLGREKIFPRQGAKMPCAAKIFYMNKLREEHS